MINYLLKINLPGFLISEYLDLAIRALDLTREQNTIGSIEDYSDNVSDLKMNKPLA